MITFSTLTSDKKKHGQFNICLNHPKDIMNMILFIFISHLCGSQNLFFFSLATLGNQNPRVKDKPDTGKPGISKLFFSH